MFLSTIKKCDILNRYACAETARGLAQCSAQGQALLSSLEDAAAGSWTLRYADQHFNPSAHVFARMEPSSPGIAACVRPFNAGASSGRHTMFMPVTGAGGVVIGVLRAEKSVQAQSGEAHGSYFSEDEMEALEGASKHCGSILQVRRECCFALHADVRFLTFTFQAACVRLNDVSKKTLQVTSHLCRVDPFLNTATGSSHTRVRSLQTLCAFCC